MTVWQLVSLDWLRHPSLYLIQWEAWATLIVGVAAVIGAIIIGQRQSGIAARQVDILEKQIGLEEVNQRMALYDRRWAVFRAATRYIEELQDSLHKPLDPQVVQEFREAKWQAFFLYGIEVTEWLLTISIFGEEFSEIRDELRTAQTDERKADLREKNWKLLGQMDAEYHRVWEVFSLYLALADAARHPPPTEEQIRAATRPS